MPDLSILIVDDEPELLHLLSIMLRRVPYPVQLAQGGQQALDMLETMTPRLIFLDVAMPDISGLDVLRILRDNPRFADTCIVLLTAVPGAVGPDEALLASKLLTKPITLRELERAVHDVLPIGRPLMAPLDHTN